MIPTNFELYRADVSVWEEKSWLEALKIRVELAEKAALFYKTEAEKEVLFGKEYNRFRWHHQKCQEEVKTNQSLLDQSKKDNK